MALFTISTKFGLRNVHAVQLEFTRGGRILILTAPHDVPSGTMMLNGKLLKKGIRLEQGTVLHRTRRHARQGEWPRYDIMRWGIFDLLSRLVRVKHTEDGIETKVARATLHALSTAYQRTLRYKTLTMEERIHLVKLERDVADNVSRAVQEYKVAMRKHLRHAGILDSRQPSRENPGKARAALTAAKMKMLARNEEVIFISQFISADVVACQSEIDRILNGIYEPILDMAVSWINFRRNNKGRDVLPDHLPAIHLGLKHAEESLKSVLVAPFLYSALQLRKEMQELLHTTDTAIVLKGFKRIRSRVMGERVRFHLLNVNIELGYLERAKQLSDEEREQRLSEALIHLKGFSNAAVRRTGKHRDAAKVVRSELLQRMHRIHSVEHGHELKRLRQDIKQLADMVNP